MTTQFQETAFTESNIETLVHRFYGKVRADAVLGPVFERTLHDQWDTHLPRMVDFWSTILTGSGRFQGNVFGKHMALSSIEPEHFRRWLALFKETALDIFPPAEAEEVLDVADRIAGSLQLGFFGERPVRVAQA